MPAWPSDLPVPRWGGFQIAPAPVARRFEVDVGPAKQSQTTTASFDRISLVYRCTGAEMSKIFSFFKKEGAGGGVWFDFVQPFTGETVNARFVADAPPSGVERAPKFDVTVPLEVDKW
jgi:hypothetical protein